MKDVLGHEDLSIGSYRFAVSRMIPQMTLIALRTHKKDMMKETPDFAKTKLLFRLSRSEYEKEWGKDYSKPDFGTRFWAVVLRYMPKIGNGPADWSFRLMQRSACTPIPCASSLLRSPYSL